MTRTLGWSNDRDRLPEYSTAPKPSPKWPSLPANAPECLRELNVVVKDPERILLVNQSNRRRDFRGLVKRLTIQLRYGCQHPSCRTRTCFTFRSRVSPAPLRTLTSVSARTMACYLAAQGDAESVLCPYLFDAALEARTKSQHISQGQNNLTGAASVRHERSSQTQFNSQSPLNSHRNQPELAAHPSRAAGESVSQQDEAKTCLENRPARRDPKSFTQNLFSTLPLKFLEFLSTPRTRNTIIPTRQVGQEPNRAGSQSQAATRFPNERQSHSPPDTKSTLKETAISANISATERRQDLVPSVQWSQRPSNDAINARAEILFPSRMIKKSYSMILPSYRRQSVVHSVLKRRRCSSAPIPTHGSPSIEQSQVPRLGTWTATLTAKPNAKGFRDQERMRLSTSRIEGPSKASQMPKPAVSSSTDQGPAVIASATDRPSQNSSHETTQNQSDPVANHEIVIVKPPETLTHFSYHVVNILYDLLTSVDDVGFEERRLRNYFERHWTENYRSTQTTNPRRLEVQSYLEQSIYYILGDPDTLLKSFRDAPTGRRWQRSPKFKILLVPHLADQAFRLLLEERSALVFQSLWQCVEILFVPPPELVSRRSSRSKASKLSSARGGQSHMGNALDAGGIQHRYLTDAEACHITLLGFHALVAAVPRSTTEIGTGVLHVRAAGKVGLDRLNFDPAMTRPIGDFMRCIEVFEDEMGLRLACRLIRGLATRLYFASVLKDKIVKGGVAPADEEQQDMMEMICTYLRLSRPNGYDEQSYADDRGSNSEADPPYSPWSMPAIIVEWIRTVMMKNWDGKEEVSRFGVVGSAITVLKTLYEKREWLGLSPEFFHMPHFVHKLDLIDVTAGWLSASHGSKTMHLLANAFLFSPRVLVTYFRALNFSIMSRAFETSVLTLKQAIKLAVLDPDDEDHNLMARLDTAVTTYLVLEVRRRHVLADAFDQLWRREKRELLRPLKVRMGLHEGEEGVDHGGVQQEFFRLAIGEALNPDYGLFKTDSETRMSWFQPLSPEPLYRFELIGLLVGLAIYNGATVPITFPRALYRKLLGLQVNEISHIRDGWPALSKGLADLLKWDKDDVKDVFVRTYEFSFDLWDTTINIDMEKTSKDEDWPGGSTMKSMEKGKKGKERAQPEMTKVKSREGDVTSHDYSIDSKPFDVTDFSHTDELEAGLVTNENREQYVKDYIFWLTDKSIRPQFEAFSRGFFTCIDKRALSIFPPEILQNVVEGLQEIDTNALEKTARYESGYSSTHPLIRHFWTVVHSYSPWRKRQLLEFVTASERVPVSGYNSILFVIQRNGPDSDRLPTSLTCFGRLLLPEYSSKRKLKQKLRLALENAKGFGVP